LTSWLPFSFKPKDHSGIALVHPIADHFPQDFPQGKLMYNSCGGKFEWRMRGSRSERKDFQCDATLHPLYPGLGHLFTNKCRTAKGKRGKLHLHKATAHANIPNNQPQLVA